jgi:hypothetical protein
METILGETAGWNLKDYDTSWIVTFSGEWGCEELFEVAQLIKR